MAPMRIATAALAFAVASCATAPQGKHFIQRQALAQIEPAERDNLFGRALSTLQRRGRIIAVSDRAGGLLTTAGWWSAPSRRLRPRPFRRLATGITTRGSFRDPSAPAACREVTAS